MKFIKEKAILNKVVMVVFNLLMLIILLSMIIVDKRVIYACQNSVNLPNIILILTGLISLIVIYMAYIKVLRKRIYNISSKKYHIALITGFIILFIVQCFIAYNIYFPTGWDVGVLRRVSDEMAQTGIKLNPDFISWGYYAANPNNVFLTSLFTLIKDIALKIGVLSGEFYVVILSIVSVNISGIFTVYTVNKLFKKRGAVLAAFFIFVVLIGLSPWIIIPYSDTYVLALTTLTLMLYVGMKTSKMAWLRWFLIFLSAGIGYLIKPTCIIVLIAIIIMEAWKLLIADSSMERIKKIKIVPVFFVVAVIVGMIGNAANSYVGYVEDEDKAKPMTHFIMMGLSERTYGTYDGNDVKYTETFATKEEKVRGNIEEIKKRFKNYGVVGSIKFLNKKLLVNYNDGTFAWGIGGNFFENAGEARNSGASVALRSLYYNGEKNYNVFASFEQCVWITLLFLMVFVNKNYLKKIDNNIIVIIMTIVGITLFTLIFESRSRYLFLYSPFYVICALSGLDNIVCVIRNKKLKK